MTSKNQGVIAEKFEKITNNGQFSLRLLLQKSISRLYFNYINPEVARGYRLPTPRTY